MKPVESPASNAVPSADDREIELKLGLSAAAAEKLRRLPLLRERAINPPETSRLETIYVDTPSLALFRAGVFLRVRRKGDRYVQALKTRGSVLSGIEARRETEIDLPDATVRPDMVVDPPSILRRKKIRKRLEPMVTTVISRTTWLLDDINGNRIELALDNGRIEADGRAAKINEIELEFDFLTFYQLTEDVTYLDCLESTLQHIEQVQADSEFGEWYGRVGGDDLLPGDLNKGHEWKASYHTVRATIQLDRWVDELLR